MKKKIINGKIIQVKIWDTAGQERYKGLTKNYFRNSDGVIITYDVTNNYSFEKVHDWIESIFKYNDSEKDIKLVLIGNTIDIEKRISSEEGKNLAKMYGIPFFESSAKKNISINDLIQKIIEDVVSNFNYYKKGINLNNINNRNYINNNSFNDGCMC